MIIIIEISIQYNFKNSKQFVKVLTYCSIKDKNKKFYSSGIFKQVFYEMFSYKPECVKGFKIQKDSTIELLYI